VNHAQPRFHPSLGNASFWLETSGDDLTPRPRLLRDESCDIAIFGGGFSALWTAYFLLKQAPQLSIVIVEREICGFGASGRNGGWLSPRFSVDTHAMIRRFGVQTAREALLAMQDIIAEVGRVCDEEGIDAQYRVTGLLGLARGLAQMPALVAAQKTYERIGLGASNRLLSADEAREQVHATGISGGLRTDAGAAVHPGRLVRGLARTVERLGARIYEKTAALRIQSGVQAGIETEGGFLSARKGVIVAGEAYITGLPQYRRSLIPMTSMIVMSEPLTAAQWKAVGWEKGQNLSSQAHTKNYLTKTTDGRILYGSRGARYQYGSRISEEAVRDEAVFEWMRGCVREWWPALSDLRFSHSWGGHLGVPRDWLSSVHFDADAKLGQLFGYTGRGVASSALSAKLLAGLITDKETGLEQLPLNRQRTPLWEPEPFRWIGIRYVQSAFERMDAAESAGRKEPIDAGLAKALGDQ
jgi:glycine/D-amino acid oxidase-like deaminating enzyme